MLDETPEPPYYAVIFTSLKTENEQGYAAMSDKMIALASKQQGFLGIESARETIGITVSYWDSIASIKKWKFNTEHTEARNKGRNLWYKKFKVRICKVEKEYSFSN